MLFMFVLVGATAVVAIGQMLKRGNPDWRRAARVGLGVALIIAGIGHFADPVPFEQHLPAWAPGATLVVASGLVEIAIGIALVVARRTVALVGNATVALLVAVFPANVYVAVAGVEVDRLPGGFYPWLRLPLQAVFIAWAWWATRDRGIEADPERPFGLMPPVPTTIGAGDASSPAGGLVQASVLELRRFRDVPAFMLAALRLRRAFVESPGAVRMTLRAAPFRRVFWTLSQWESDDDLRGFVDHPAHREVMTRFRPRMAHSRFVIWTSPLHHDLDWATAAERLAGDEQADRRRAGEAAMC